MRSTSFAPDDHAAQARARKGVAHPTIFRLKQTGTHPPAFELVIKAPRTDVLHPSYLRFMENRLREKFGFKAPP